MAPPAPRSPGDPGLRIGDRERAAAAERLTTHHAAGRLSLEELEERLEQAGAAVFARDLAALERDLPGPAVRVRRAPRVLWGLVVLWLFATVLAVAIVGHPVPPFFLIPVAIWLMARRTGRAPWLAPPRGAA